MILNALNILDKVNLSFDEFQNTFDPEKLHEALVDLCQIAGRSLQYCPGITKLLGSDEDSLQGVDITYLPVGSTIIVGINAALFQYTLTSNDLQSVAPYIIRSDNSTELNPRSWVRAASMFGTFTYEDVDGSGILKLTHNLGFPYFNVLIFDQVNKYRHDIAWEPSDVKPNEEVWVTIGMGFEGTWKILICY